MKLAIALIASLFVIAVHGKEIPTEKDIRDVFNQYKHDKDQGEDKDKEHGLSFEEMKTALEDKRIGIIVKEAYAPKFFNDADTDDDNHLDEDEFLILTLYLKSSDNDVYIQEVELEGIVVAVKSIFPKDKTTKQLYEQGNIITDDAGLNFEEFRLLMYFHLGDTDNDDKLNKAELKAILGKIGNDKITANSDALFDQANGQDADPENLNYEEAWPLLYFAIHEKANDQDDELDQAEFVSAVSKLNSKLADKAATKFGTLDTSANGKLSFAEFKKAAKWIKTTGKED